MNLLRKPFKYSFWYVTLILALLNVGVFILTEYYGWRLGFRMPGLDWYLGLSVLGLKCNFWWQPVTYMFTHGSLQHIFFNVLALVVFGLAVERTIGSKEFLLFYFFCGIFDGLVSVGMYALFGVGVYLIGASGCVYALLLMYAVLFPRSRIYIWGIIPVPAPLLVAVYAVIEIVSQVFSIRGGTAHLAHLTGFALAWLYLVVRMGVHPIKVWRDAYR